MVQVAAALIWRGDRFMICQRPVNKTRALEWEFVGGKVEPGETKREALARECREELGVAVSVGDVYMELTHVYPDLTIHLTLFHAKITDGVPQLLEHCAMDWITPEEIGRRVKERMRKVGEFPVLIRADYRARHKSVAEVMNACTMNGIWKLSFVAVYDRKSERK